MCSNVHLDDFTSVFPT